MKPRRGKAKLVVRFDEEARRDYLTGFHKRKKQRQKKAQLAKLQKAKEVLREMKRERRSEMKKKMQQYGLEENEERSESNQEMPSSSMLHDYPHQIVIVNTHPTLGTTLSSLVDQEEDEKEEGKVATKGFSSAQQSHSSGRPPVKDHRNTRTIRKNKKPWNC